MSRPFIIWTMQRTGGTALAELLMALSEHPSAEHEPFNWSRKQPRQFWPIADRWNKTQDAAALSAELDAIFARNVLIKHCYELLAMPFNKHLMQAAAKSPYRQILLLRRDEMARLTSKFIAELQGTWFPDYARRVFGEVIDGRRPLAPLPIPELVRISAIVAPPPPRWRAGSVVSARRQSAFAMRISIRAATRHAAPNCTGCSTF